MESDEGIDQAGAASKCNPLPVLRRKMEGGCASGDRDAEDGSARLPALLAWAQAQTQ